MISLVEESLCEAYSFIPQFFHREPDLTWFMNPEVPLGSLNGVFNARLPHDAASCVARIEQMSTIYRIAQVPFTWHVTPSCTPSNLGELLETQGFHYDGEAPAMALELSKLPELHTPVGLSIKLVNTKEMLERWTECFADVYKIPREKMKISFPFHAAAGFAPDSIVQHFLGILNSEVVSISRVAYARDSLVLSGIAVLDKYRRKGMGAAVTLYPLHLARKRGFKYAVLASTSIAFPLYKTLGFQECFKIKYYSKHFN
jgi:ribosomal protein S18 acetylase RimI-like enzyme